MENSKEYILPKDTVSMSCDPQGDWGGAWTEDKLDTFEKYVKAYLTIMKRYATGNDWKLFYFDAFAGSGSREANQGGETDNEATLFSEAEIAELTEQTSYKGAAERILGIECDRFSFDYFYSLTRMKSHCNHWKKSSKNFSLKRLIAWRLNTEMQMSGLWN